MKKLPKGSTAWHFASNLSGKLVHDEGLLRVSHEGVTAWYFPQTAVQEHVKFFGPFSTPDSARQAHSEYIESRVQA